MISNDFLKQLSEKAAQLSPLASSVQKEFATKLNSLLQTSFQQLNLVSREEFDAQVQVLERAQKTITALEAKVSAMEKNENSYSS